MTDTTIITLLTNTNRPFADILREMADTTDADGNVTVSAEFLETLDKRISALANGGEQSDVNRFRQDNPSNS